MRLSTAKRRINKTLDELTQSVIDDWYANFKNGYIRGYTDAKQGKAPMYAEAYKVAEQTERIKTLDYCDIILGANEDDSNEQKDLNLTWSDYFGEDK